MKRYCFALDLLDDKAIIEDYEYWHSPENVWPEVKASMVAAGIQHMEIYRTGNRLFMIMETHPDFSLDKKAAMDAGNEKVQQWEQLMWQFQQRLPWAKPGEKWVAMQQIFKL